MLPSSVGSRLVSPDGEVGAAGAVVFLITTALVGWWTWRRRRWLTARAVVPEADLLQRMLILFMCTYAAGIVISMVIFDDLVQLDARILAPVFACLVILLSAAAPRALGRMWQRGRLRVPTVAAIAVVAASLTLRVRRAGADRALTRSDVLECRLVGVGHAGARARAPG